nr:nuclear exosome regulator NRDE2-like isoform X3 [Procambarus clarkii]
MSLFPAYSVEDNSGSQPEASSASLSWLTNESCPPEAGQQIAPTQPQSDVSEEAENSKESGEASESPPPEEAKPPPPKKKKKKKRKKHKSHKNDSNVEESSDEVNRPRKKHKDKKLRNTVTNKRSSESRTRSTSPQRTIDKRARLRSHSRSGSRAGYIEPRKMNSRNRSKSRTKRSKSRSKRSRSWSRKRRSISGPRSRRSDSWSRNRRSVSGPRSRRSRSWSRNRRPKSRSRSRRSRSWSRNRRSKSGSRSKRSRSWSRNRKSKSRSRSRRSKSRSRSRRSKSRSRSRRSRLRRSRSGSRKSSSRSRSRIKRFSPRSKLRRSRSGSKKRRGNRLPQSRFRKSRSRSYSPYVSKRRWKSKSRSRSREHVRRKNKDKKPKESEENYFQSEKIVSNSKSIFLEGLRGLVKPEEAFFISQDGDRNNTLFPTTHYSQLASYKLRIKGALGSSSSKKETVKSKNKTLRYFKRIALRMLYSDAENIILLPKESTEAKEKEHGYIPLGLTYAEEAKLKNAGQQSEVNPLGIYDSATEHYLLGIGTGKQEESQSSHKIEYEYWHKKAKLYNERLGKEPSNIPLWLEFVRFQDDAYIYLFQGTDSNNKDSKKKHKRNLKALAERKISILDSAIKKNFRSVELQFQRLEIGKDIWDDKKLKQEWGTLIFNFPNKIKVWHQYLIFMKTHFTSFNLSAVVQTFAKCTERLQQMHSGVFLTHSPPPDLGKCLVDIAVQLAHVWRQGGYMERSIALCQALVELNLYSPKYLCTKDTPVEAKIAVFEAFWDSRAPRFGEEKAIGWGQVMERKQKVEFPEVILSGTQDEEDDIIAQGGTTSRLWLALETSRERHHWMPWEQDPEDCEDPERMVPFEELSPHLFILDTVEERFYLILQFLKFFGVPDTKSVLLHRSTVNKGQKINKNERKSASSSDNAFEPQIIETLYDIDLFGLHFQFRKADKNCEILNFDTVGPSLLNTSCEKYYEFLCRLLQQASDVFEQSYRNKLTVLYIKFLSEQYLIKKKNNYDKAMLKNFGRELKKHIKNTLKLEEFRMYLPVYQEYGKVEENMGHFDEAENVYATALTIGTVTGNALDVANLDLSAVMDLYSSYIHLEMDREAKLCNGKHSNNVMYSLCSIVIDGKFSVANGSPAPGGNVLKTKKKLNELLDLYSNSITFNSDNSATKDNEKLLAGKLVMFLAILELLTVGFQSACLIFEDIFDKINGICKGPVPHKLEDILLPSECVVKTPDLQEKSKNNVADKLTILESLYEDYVWLIEVSSQLEHLVSDSRMSPVSLRKVLTAAVKVAPENQRFLLLLAQNQSWRDLLGGLEMHSQRSSSIVVLVSQILPHIQRTITLIANTDEGSLSCGHRLESVLEKGISQPPGNHCPLLWRLYLALVAATRPKKLKDLIYRALSHCPGIKVKGSLHVFQIGFNIYSVHCWGKYFINTSFKFRFSLPQYHSIFTNLLTYINQFIPPKHLSLSIIIIHVMYINTHHVNELVLHHVMAILG